ncbi:MAG: CDP-alcohol phosphatidyltransferase family protein [Actinobacteria bacterium]|nr:CDP-alcohol phosphatidyltransferase family protein [Actinomycetota bacterium]
MDSYSRLEHLALTPVRRALAAALWPAVAMLRRLRVPPNAVSLSQIPLGFVVGVLMVPSPRVAFGLFVAAVLLDALDGALARATGQGSGYGALVDQVSDHIREITMVGSLVAIGALRGEIGVAYAVLYPVANVLLYLANRCGAPVPLAVKTWLAFYPFLFAYLWFGLDWLDPSAATSCALMALTSGGALLRLRRRMGGSLEGPA